MFDGAGGGYDRVFNSVSYATSGQEIEEVHLTGTGNINASGGAGVDRLYGNGVGGAELVATLTGAPSLAVTDIFVI